MNNFFICLGPDISISSILGFVRALCVSKQIKRVLSTEDWVMLITKMCDLAAIKHESSAGNSLFIQVGNSLFIQVGNSLFIQVGNSLFIQVR